MKYKILLIIIISFSFLFAEQPEEFQFNQSSEQCFYFVQSAELDEVSLTEDDWIGAFNNDICVGSSVWEGEFTTIAVMGDDGFAYSSGYCENGDIPLFKVWDSETEQIWEFSDNSAIPGWNSNGTYIIENIGAYTASPKIEISTTELIFDDTIVNETSIGNFYIRNIGEETLTGSVSAPQFFSVYSNRNVLEFEISAGDSLQITTAFSPLEEIEYSDQLEINSNSSINPQIFIDVTGIGIQAHIQSEPELLEFENVWFNHSVQKNLTISNDGSSVLNVTEIECAEAAYSFSPENFSVEIGEEQIVIVTFSPTAIQNYDTGITFISNIENYSVNLAGNGYLLEADIEVNPDSVEVGNSVQFNNNSSGDVLSYLWDFGDGNTSELENPNYDFPAIGDYLVTLTVSDQYFSDDYQINYTVYGLPEIEISTQDIEFDNTYWGVTTEPQILTIYSVRTESVVIDSIYFTEECGAFDFASPEIPITIPPNDSINVSVTFTPNSAGINMDFIEISNNSINDESAMCLVRGTGLVVPPKPVENVQIDIEIEEGNVVLTWDPVIESILNTPVDVHHYKIVSSPSPEGPFGWEGTTQNLNFTHHEIGLNEIHFFYRVIAVLED